MRCALDRLQPEKPHATEFRAVLGGLGITQHRLAQLFGVGARSVRRWRDGERRVPCGVDIVLRLLAAGMVTIAEVERAAVTIPARTNGSAKRSAPASLRVEPAPEQSALVQIADPGRTTAEKVCALTPEECRWPCGEPNLPGFHFCKLPVTTKPYCPRHHSVAYVARPTGHPVIGGATPAAKALSAVGNNPKCRTLSRSATG